MVHILVKPERLFKIVYDLDLDYLQYLRFKAIQQSKVKHVHELIGLNTEKLVVFLLFMLDLIHLVAKRVGSEYLIFKQHGKFRVLFLIFQGLLR